MVFAFLITWIRTGSLLISLVGTALWCGVGVMLGKLIVKRDRFVQTHEAVEGEDDYNGRTRRGPELDVGVRLAAAGA